jgi:MFS family permease
MGDAEILLNQSLARARKRLLPFLLSMYVVSFLDRTNIGFAKQALQQSVGISEAAYALGAGLFFLTYALFETPSNLILHRVGAKIWLSRIMVTWGLLSAATLFAKGEVSFCILRALLGAAEAGFFPGVVLYLTYWFPNRIRGHVLGLFYLGVPLSFVLGAPLSGFLLQIHGTLLQGGLNLQGWQWMFLVEGLLAVLGGLLAYWYLDDKPGNARWLPEQEKQVLLEVLSQEDVERRTRGSSSFSAVLRNPRVLMFSLIYFSIQIGVYGVVFYLPSDVASILGESIGLRVGLVSAIPWVFSLLATYWLPRLADQYRSHRLLAGICLFASGVAIAVLSLTVAGSGSLIALSALCVAASGLIAVQPLFWTFPTNYLSGSGAAGGIAIISALGNLGGFIAPNIKVRAEIHFGSHMAGPLTLAALVFPGVCLIAAIRNQKV